MAQKVIHQHSPPGYVGRPQIPAEQGPAKVTGQLETAVDPDGLEMAGCLSTVHAVVSTQRVQKVIFHAGLPVAGPEEAGPWRPVLSGKAGLAASRPPSPAARPSARPAWPSPGSPKGLTPGAARPSPPG